MKKYELTDETKTTEDGKVLHRIRALRDFGNVKTGQLGGFVEAENNLSHDGSAWIYDDAVACDQAIVCDRARVQGWAVVRDAAHVYGMAIVRGNAIVRGEAIVCDQADVRGRAVVYGWAIVQGMAIVGGNVGIYGNDRIRGYARIFSQNDILIIDGIGSRNGTTTIYRSQKGIEVSCGCFQGTMEDFEAQVKKTHGDNRFAQEYGLAIDLAKKHFEVKE